MHLGFYSFYSLALCFVLNCDLLHFAYVVFCIYALFVLLCFMFRLFVVCVRILHQLDHEAQIIGINSEVHNQVETCSVMVLFQVETH